MISRSSIESTRTSRSNKSATTAIAIVPGTVQQMVSNLRSNSKSITTSLRGNFTRNKNTLNKYTKRREDAGVRTHDKERGQLQYENNKENLHSPKTEDSESAVSSIHDDFSYGYERESNEEFITNNRRNNFQKTDNHVVEGKCLGYNENYKNDGVQTKNAPEKDHDKHDGGISKSIIDNSSQISCLYDWDDNTTYQNHSSKKHQIQNYNKKTQDEQKKVNKHKSKHKKYYEDDKRNNQIKRKVHMKALSLMNGPTQDERDEKLRKELQYRSQLKAQIEEKRRAQFQETKNHSMKRSISLQNKTSAVHKFDKEIHNDVIDEETETNASKVNNNRHKQYDEETNEFEEESVLNYSSKHQKYRNEDKTAGPMVIDSTFDEIEQLKKYTKSRSRQKSNVIGWSEESVATCNKKESLEYTKCKELDFDDLSIMYSDMKNERDRLREELSKRTNRLKRLEDRTKTLEAGQRGGKNAIPNNSNISPCTKSRGKSQKRDYNIRRNSSIGIKNTTRRNDRPMANKRTSL